jgi:dienelactone hydrolase
MKMHRFGIIFAILSGPLLFAQAGPGQARAILDHTLQSPKVVTFQLQEYLMRRLPKLPSPSNATEWTAEVEKIRKHLLNDVVFHGWPKAWVDSPPKFEDLGPIPSGPGYTLRKLRYEIVPGFYSTAILYEPAHLEGRVPAVLNVMGHFDLGKAMPFEQKLCINLALRGMMALNLEWIGMGELNRKQDNHWYGADLDLVGANGVGLFYLAMRRGLDYLAANPHVDPKRLGVTGLSGGGWQTIVLSALDNRVYASVPVAGYNTLAGSIGRMPLAPSEPGDFEQEPTDFRLGHDYDTLTAMRAPRPTLLINNAEDSCCYRAPLARPNIYDPIKPFYALYGKSDALEFHENTDPSTHNYELDNRQHAYRFFTRAFGLPVAEHEIPVDAYVKSYDELAVGVPEDNLTILGLARKFGAEITRTPVPAVAARDAWATAERAKLKSVVRYNPVEVREAWREGNTKDKGVESLWYRFELSNGLSATGIWIKGIVTPDDAPLTVVLDDKGKKAAGKETWDRMPWVTNLVNSGQQVLVLDLMFTGEAAPDESGVFFADMLASTGKRPLGLEAAQLLALTDWARKQWKPRELRLETAGIRSQVEGLVAAALAPHLFLQVVTHAGMKDFSYLLDEPVSYTKAPELFCLDLDKDFDLSRLAAIAEPTKVVMLQNLKLTPTAEKETNQ